jgi:phage N-6-adenine-methyltransferase
MSTNLAYGGRKARFTEEWDQSAWGTPWKEFNEWNEEFGFTIDVCADENNHKLPRYFTKEQDGLKQDWSKEIFFSNPPFDEIDIWLTKAWEETFKGAVGVTVAKADTSTKWFHKWYERMISQPPNKVRFLSRIQFVPPPGYIGSVNQRTGEIRKAPGSPNMGSVLFIHTNRILTPKNAKIGVICRDKPIHAWDYV